MQTFLEQGFSKELPPDQQEILRSLSNPDVVFMKDFAQRGYQGIVFEELDVPDSSEPLSIIIGGRIINEYTSTAMSIQKGLAMQDPLLRNMYRIYEGGSIGPIFRPGDTEDETTVDRLMSNYKVNRGSYDPEKDPDPLPPSELEALILSHSEKFRSKVPPPPQTPQQLLANANINLHPNPDNLSPIWSQSNAPILQK